METEYVMEIARTIREQLVSLTPMPVIMSWGIEGFAATVYKDMPALQIEVNGRLHTGYVIVRSTARIITKSTCSKAHRWSASTTRYASTNWET